MPTREKIREGLPKQEWVQKYLEDILADAWRRGAHKQGIDVTEEADKARLHLTKWGVVIKVDGELPNDAIYRPPKQEEAYCAGRDTVTNAGYVAVEPLVVDDD